MCNVSGLGESGGVQFEIRRTWRRSRRPCNPGILTGSGRMHVSVKKKEMDNYFMEVQVAFRENNDKGTNPYEHKSGEAMREAADY
jgi:hypothetical protein